MRTMRNSFWTRAGIWVATSQLIAGIALAEDRSGAVVAQQDPCESNRDLDDRSKRDNSKVTRHSKEVQLAVLEPRRTASRALSFSTRP